MKHDPSWGLDSKAVPGALAKLLASGSVSCSELEEIDGVAARASMKLLAALAYLHSSESSKITMSDSQAADAVASSLKDATKKITSLYDRAGYHHQNWTEEDQLALMNVALHWGDKAEVRPHIDAFSRRLAAISKNLRSSEPTSLIAYLGQKIRDIKDKKSSASSASVAIGSFMSQLPGIAGNGGGGGGGSAMSSSGESPSAKRLRERK